MTDMFENEKLKKNRLFLWMKLIFGSINMLISKITGFEGRKI